MLEYLFEIQAFLTFLFVFSFILWRLFTYLSSSNKNIWKYITFALFVLLSFLLVSLSVQSIYFFFN
jgi:hypothetical protein